METIRRRVLEPIGHMANVLNGSVGKSTFGRAFRLEGSEHKHEIKNSRFTTEVRAGMTTFFTMAYIIAVNATILADSGGTCESCDRISDRNCEYDPTYSACIRDLRRSMITATAAVAGLSSILFGFVTNMPVCLAPGMGLNAYFAYQVVGYHGSGNIPYRLALTAVFVEGFIFIFLALVGMRQWLVRIIPESLKTACACGIGLYLALIGLGYSAGIGLVTAGDVGIPLTLGGCPPEYVNQNGGCKSHKMTNPAMWIGIFCGGIVTAYLMTYKVKMAMLVGIAVVSFMSWPRDTSFTYFPYTEIGEDRWNYFKKVVHFHDVATLNALDWDISKSPGKFGLALFTFLYVDIIDCTATLFSMARFSGVVDPETGDFPRSTLAYCTDAFSISIGALFGVSPVTTFIESGAGIVEGGKTGLTAITCGFCFIVSMFFAPIFTAIPPVATGCTLVIVGCLMMRSVVHINWAYIGDALPAFVTLMLIPFSYSAAYGLIGGLLVYAALNGPVYLTKLATRGRITPPDEEHREYWTFRPGGENPWFLRMDDLASARSPTPDAVHSARRSTSRGGVEEHELQDVTIDSRGRHVKG